MSGQSPPIAADAPLGVTWDESAWPVIRIAFTDAPGDDERAMWVLSQFERTFTRRERYLCIIDLTQATRVASANGRQAIGQWQKDHHDEMKRWGAGGALLLKSAIVRGALTAVNWVHKAPAPVYYAPSMRDAVEWCMKTAKKAGVPVSEEAERLLWSAV